LNGVMVCNTVIFCIRYHVMVHLVEALHYKPEGCGFDS